MWECDPKKMFLRNELYDRVWEGCGGLVCEAHIVKYFDKTEDNIVNTFWNQQEYFYDYERWVLTDPGPRPNAPSPKEEIVPVIPEEVEEPICEFMEGQPCCECSVSYTHLTLPTILRV